MDQVETSILAASLETIDRIGPCKAKISVLAVEDVRVTKRGQVVDRAKEILAEMSQGGKAIGLDLKEEVRQAVQVSEIVSFGGEKLPAGPNVADSDAIIVVEGRSDVLNLLKSGIKNAIAVEGTAVPDAIVGLAKEKVVTAFVDGDRGGDLILKELLQVAEVDFVAKAPRGKEVEELTHKQIMKALRNKAPAEQFMGAPVAPKAARVPMEAPERRPSPSRAPTKKAERAPPKPQEVRLSPELLAYQEEMQSLVGSSKARLLTEKKGKKTASKEVAVRDLVDTLKKGGKGVTAVVFDGIVTQRIVDIASDNGVEYVIGMKSGSIVKQPADVKVFTAEDLQVK